MHVCMGCVPAGDGRGRDAHELGDGPLHVLLPYGDAIGADGRHLSSVPARSFHQDSGGWRSCWRIGSSERTG
jgi:hypothetical protein